MQNPAHGGESGARLASVTALFSSREAIGSDSALVADAFAAQPSEAAPSTAEDRRDDAEQALVRRLRRSALSVAEVKRFLSPFALDSCVHDALIEQFVHGMYLDDRALAEQLVRAGQRKKQGRAATRRALAQRGIPPEVVDEVLADEPDRDAEQALEYARAKLRAMSSLDAVVAERRLMGQLARRGFNPAVGLLAVRTALSESRNSSGIRFR